MHRTHVCTFPLSYGPSIWMTHFDIPMKGGVGAAARKLPMIRRKCERIGMPLWSTSHTVIAVMKMTPILHLLTGE